MNTSTEPRYRYYDEAPEMISLPVVELLARIPREYRDTERSAPAGQNLELPCREVFQGNTPRLRLGVLRELLPDIIHVPEGADPDRTLPLPAGWLALHYRLISRREELPPDPASIPVSEVQENESQPAMALPVVLPESPLIGEKDETQKSGIDSLKEPEEGLTPAAPVLEAKKRGFFASLPIFRRQDPVPQPVIIAKEEVTPILVVTGKPEGVTVEDELQGASDTKETEEITTRKILPPKESGISLESLWKLDPSDQFADPSAFQALFMTEEKLTLERVMALAGQLPGLRACVLAHGERVVCASSTPAGLDLQRLSSQATTMLAQIRESSSRMGLGSVPAITLHAEQGVLSFLYQEELCLLVLHGDRGFLPGVRERLAEMLGHLSAAKALPGGPSAQSSLPI